MKKFNHIAIVTVAVLHQLIGFVWYSEPFFGGAWLASIDKTADDVDPSNAQPYVVSVFAAIVFGYFLSWVLRETQTHTAKKGALVGLLLGIVITAVLAMHYSFLQLSWTTAMIDGGTTLLGAAVSGAILAVWRKI